MSNRIRVKVNDRFINRSIEFFNQVQIQLSYNSVASSFGFLFYFNPDNERHQELACVSHYHPVEVFYDDELLIRGVIIDQDFTDEAKPNMASFSGYSKPGIIEDCQIPPTVSLQADGISLESIAKRLVPKVGDRRDPVKIVIDEQVRADMGRSYDTSTASETSTIKQYLADLAKQRDIIISHDAEGNLLFTRLDPNKAPVLEFDLRQGTPPGVKFNFAFRGQGIHSHITVRKQAGADGGNAGEATVRNPYVVGSYYRPKVVNYSSGDDVSASLAARRELANELRNLPLRIELEGWTVDDVLLRPADIITITAPSLFIYKERVKFMVESVEFYADQEIHRATINCVLTEVYTNQSPVNIYEGLNLFAKPHV